MKRKYLIFISFIFVLNFILFGEKVKSYNLPDDYCKMYDGKLTDDIYCHCKCPDNYTLKQSYKDGVTTEYCESSDGSKIDVYDIPPIFNDKYHINNHF